MVEGGGGARLAEQATVVAGKRAIRLEDLERDLPAESGVPRAVDRAHAATAEQRLDDVGTDGLPWLQCHRARLYVSAPERARD